MQVLLIEDDIQVAEPLAENLGYYGYRVSCVRTGLAAVEHPEVNIILLDLGLPDLDGLEVCRRLRLRSGVPIIVISARSAESDRVLALELGADDYIVKPFGIRELIARMQAVSRRSRQLPAASEPATNVANLEDRSPPIRRYGAVLLDTRQRQVLVDEVPAALTRKEFDILDLLMADPGAVVRRNTIIEQVWDGVWFGSTRTVDAHISSLRRKLQGALLIETKRGVGFRLAMPSAVPHGTASGWPSRSMLC